MVVCAVTPIVWNLSGRPAEAYPELAFFLIGIPWAISLVVAAAFIAARGFTVTAWEISRNRPFVLSWGIVLTLPGLLILAAWVSPDKGASLIMVFTWGMPFVTAASGMFAVTKTPRGDQSA